MENSKNTQYNFLRKIEDSIYQKDETPLIAGFYPLNLNDLTSHLGDFFKLEDFSIEITKKELLNQQEILSGFSEKVSIFPIVLSPLASPVFLMIDEKDKGKFTSWALPIKEFDSKPLEDGFLLFMLINTLDSLAESNFISGLSPKLTKASLGEEGYCLDILLKKASSSINLRISLSDSFRKQWNQYYKEKSPYQMPTALTDITDAFISFKLGSVVLSEKQILSVKNGDFISLDKIHYDALSNKGSLRVLLDKNCLFRAKVTENKIKLLEYSYYDEELIMSPEENMPEEKNVKPAPQKTTSIQDVPFEISVEVARISLPLSQLKELQPGNYLPLSVTPEEGVLLTINNKVVGKAELVYLGEKLGIRLVEWGTHHNVK